MPKADFTPNYRRDGRRTPIADTAGRRLEYASPAWHQRYAELHSQHETRLSAADARRPPGSLAALIAAYKASPDWDRLAASTRRDWGKVLATLEVRFGTLPVATMPSAWVWKLRDSLAGTPREANRYLQVLSRLMNWGIARDWRPDRVNPVKGVEKLQEGPGYEPWDETEIAWFFGVASEQAVLAAAVGLMTGQRGGDVRTMTWAQYDGSAIEVVQAKTGARLWIPCHPLLRDLLNETRRRRVVAGIGAVTILTTSRGKPWSTYGFRHWFGDEVAAASLTGRTCHGLRKVATGWLIEAGCSEREVRSILGHTSSQPIETYARGADQRRLAYAAIGRLGEQRQVWPTLKV